VEKKHLTEDEIYAQNRERIKDDFIPLYTKDGKQVDVGYNSRTKIVYKDIDQMTCDPTLYTEDETEAIKDARWRKWQVESAKKESKKFDAAEKIKFSEWEGEQFSDGEDFFVDISDFFDGIIEAHGFQYDEWPEYVWATKPKPYITKKDAFSVYENDIEEIDTGYDPDVHGVKVLQMALDAFVDVNKENVLYWQDESLALLISDEIEEYRKRYED